jgi:hypothetical protein
VGVSVTGPSNARPRLVSATADPPFARTTLTSPPASASSQTEWRGQVLRQASIASAYERGRPAIQVRSSRVNGCNNWSTSRFCPCR